MWRGGVEVCVGCEGGTYNIIECYNGFLQKVCANFVVFNNTTDL